VGVSPDTDIVTLYAERRVQLESLPLGAPARPKHFELVNLLLALLIMLIDDGAELRRTRVADVHPLADIVVNVVLREREVGVCVFQDESSLALCPEPVHEIYPVSISGRPGVHNVPS
jgi:hypothetical protein